MDQMYYPEQYRAFRANTGNHEMRILHEDGLYRHLRFAEPGTGIWHFDLVTWPGSLAIRGDIGEGFIFTRIDDMLDFFDTGRRAPGEINATYWAEKLDRGSPSVREFSDKQFRAWLRDREHGALVAESEDEVGDVGSAIAFLNERGIEWDGEDPETWEDYEYHFILALHAILWGAQTYHAAKAKASSTESSRTTPDADAEKPE